MLNHRASVKDALELLSSASEQMEYARTVPHVNVVGELYCICNDIYSPKSAAFNEASSLRELRDLAHLYGLIVEASFSPVATVDELLKQNQWRRVIQVASELAARL